MSADPEVMIPLGGVVSESQALAEIARREAVFACFGFGRWVVERRADGAFVGVVGLALVHQSLPLPAGFEMGWRLVRDAWGQGFASEAAKASIADAFDRCGLTEVFAFTSLPNLRSQAVMARIGLQRTPTLDFDHPALSPEHPQRRHLVWMARREG
jgi:RimJ/RimL family protein N-acetyltransferase